MRVGTHPNPWLPMSEKNIVKKGGKLQGRRQKN